MNVAASLRGMTSDDGTPLADTSSFSISSTLMAGIVKHRQTLRQFARLPEYPRMGINGVVRRVLAADEKPLHWVGPSKRDFLSFPAAVKEDMGNALGIARFGGDAFQKKSTCGIRTAKRDVELVAERLKTAARDYEEHHGKQKR